MTRTCYFGIAALLFCSGFAHADSGPDTDHDGLPDALEQSLLQQFAPGFMLDKADCAGSPAEFTPNLASPSAAAVNGTIYGQVFPGQVFPGQVFPVTTSGKAAYPVAEIHFYHLWSRDCGTYGHRLDTEHVSALIEASGADLSSATWKAVYWYAGAHEGTVCDVSQITRAAAVHAESRGALVWISSGKHASFFKGDLVRHGCGGDFLGEGIFHSAGTIVNIGEPDFPMNGALWTRSAEWPLAAKMARSDFSAERIARVDALPAAAIVRVKPGRHAAQGVIAAGGSTAGAVETGGRATTDAMEVARGSTDNALKKSYRSAVRGLSKSLDRTAAALRLR